MKKWIVVLLSVFFLTGCGSAETFDTMGQIDHVSATKPTLRSVTVTLPEDALMEVSDSNTGVTLYECDGYTIYLQTFDSGNLQATIRGISGFAPEDLMVMESVCGDHTRYDWVWTAVADEGELVCRGAILDDGGYHYSMCVVGDVQSAGKFGDAWNTLFSSFCLQA